VETRICLSDIQNRVIALVKSILKQNAITSEVNAESVLVDVGLNSVDMVNLMLEVESEFDFTIPQAEINRKISSQSKRSSK